MVIVVIHAHHIHSKIQIINVKVVQPQILNVHNVMVLQSINVSNVILHTIYIIMYVLQIAQMAIMLVLQQYHNVYHAIIHAYLVIQTHTIVQCVHGVII
jgi:hypothetical protein